MGAGSPGVPLHSVRGPTGGPGEIPFRAECGRGNPHYQAWDSYDSVLLSRTMFELPPLAEHDNPQRRAAQRARWAARPRPGVTLDQLHTFLAVAERQHVSEAAEALGISQGSVSTVVHRLEKRLGLALCQGGGGTVRLAGGGLA